VRVENLAPSEIGVVEMNDCVFVASVSFPVSTDEVGGRGEGGGKRGDIHNRLLVLYIFVRAAAEICTLCLGAREFFVELLESPLTEAV